MQDVFVIFLAWGGEKLILDIVYFAYEICPPGGVLCEEPRKFSYVVN